MYFTLTLMWGATPRKMKDFAVTFTTTFMSGQASPLTMTDALESVTLIPTNPEGDREVAIRLAPV